MKPTLDDILELSKTSPVIHCCLMHYHRETLTLDEALMEMVLMLDQQLNDQDKVIVGLFQRQPDLIDMAKLLVDRIHLLEQLLHKEWVNDMINIDSGGLLGNENYESTFKH